MTPGDLLSDAFDRVHSTVQATLDGLTDAQLTTRPGPGANTIAWLVWHLVRVQDDHVAEVAGREQIWTDGGFAARFGLDLDDAETGYGFSDKQVDAVRVSAADLAAYASSVNDRTTSYLAGLREGDLDTIVDDTWDPPVTLGVRLVSVLNDDLQHAGQASYVRGLVTR